VLKVALARSDGRHLGKHVALVLTLLLLFAGLASSAAGKKHLPKPKQLTPTQQERRLGPKPTPHWYWRWVPWRLGEGFAKGHPRGADLRPKQAPHRIPHWAWRRLHFFLRVRASAASKSHRTKQTKAKGTAQTKAKGTAHAAPTSSSNYERAISYTGTRPSFVPMRTLMVSNAAELQAAISNLQPGDLVRAATKFTVNGETVIKNRLSSPAELDLSGVRFVYSGGQNNPAVYLNNARNLYIFGGDMSTADTGGQGILDAGSQHVLWWGFTIHDTGSTGFAARAIGGPVDNDDFQGTIWKIGQHLGWDTHCVNECGTGLHGANLWDGATAGNFTNNRFAFYAHDIPTGACVEFGNDDPTSQATGNVLYLKCMNATDVARKQTGGNALQIWGHTDRLGLDVKYVEGENLQGFCLQANGISSGQTAKGVTVEYGRASHTNLNPRYAGQNPWDRSAGVVYKALQPAP
jgi:hypothetical protein